jgi:Tfp pilus assembly protein PilX
MEQQKVMDALVQSKRMNRYLTETFDLTQQLAEALDREDEVTVKMLFNMRAESIEHTKEADAALRELCHTMPTDQDKQRLRALLAGGASEDTFEKQLSEQSMSNKRRLSQIQELDKRISMKLAREKSAYHK